MTSPLTNTRSGSFHKLELLNSSDDFQDLLSLISAGAGGIATLNVAGGGITISGSGSSRTLTVDLSALATTAAVTTGLATKQPLISATTDITPQDVTLRNLTASASAFTIQGGVISYIRDNLGRLLMDLQNSRVEFLKSVNFTQPFNAFAAITIHDAAASRSGQLWIAAGNKLQWQ